MKCGKQILAMYVNVYAVQNFGENELYKQRFKRKIVHHDREQMFACPNEVRDYRSCT
jgi:hypothetical protein